MRSARARDEGRGAGEPKTKSRFNKEAPEFSGVRFYFNSFQNLIAKQAPKQFFKGVAHELP